MKVIRVLTNILCTLSLCCSSVYAGWNAESIPVLDKLRAIKGSGPASVYALRPIAMQTCNLSWNFWEPGWMTENS